MIFPVKNLISPKPSHIKLDKIDGFIRIYDGTRHLLLFGPEIYDSIYHRIRYLASLKISITYVFTHYFTKVKLILMILTHMLQKSH